MLLTFKTVDHVIFKIDVDPTEKVKSLKKRIENDRGTEYVAEGMKLLFAGKILDDEKTISEYSISDKGFIVIMVPRPKIPGKESGKKQRSNPVQLQGISIIHENKPFDGHFLGTNSTNPAIPLDYPPWQGHEHPPRSGSFSDNEASTGRLFESLDSSESGPPARVSKRHSFRSDVSSDSSRRVTATLQDGATSPRVRAASPAADDVSLTASRATHETDVVTTPLQSLDEQTKLSEVSNWLDRHVSEDPTSLAERFSNADETVGRNVQKIVEMGFEREQAEAALNASFNSVEGALEYLVVGFPPAAPPEPRVPSFAWIPPAVQQSHSRTDLDDPLEFLQTDEEFQYLRHAVQKDPDLLSSALETFRSLHSDLEPVFEAFEDRLVELLTEPVDDSGADTSRSPATDLPSSDPPVSKTPQNSPAEPLRLHVESPQSSDRLDPPPQSFDRLDPSPQSSDRLDPSPQSFDRLVPSMVVDRVPDPDDSTSSSPAPSHGERRISPVGEDTSVFRTPPEEEEDVNYESFRDEEEEKLSEDLIRALLLQDQEEERSEAERGVAAAETIPWSDAESLESGVGGRRDGRGGGHGLGGGRTLEDMGYVRVTMEEKQAIDRLKSLGFTEERVVQVYLACEKNEEMAANILLDKD